MEQPNYYAVIPAKVRYDKKLRANEKLLYAEISSLTIKTGECWASNNYFASLYEVTPQAISKWINNLEKAGYIKSELIYDGQAVEKRIIRLLGVSTNVDRVSTNVDGGYQQMFKENNTSINNKNKKEIIIKKKFTPPTLDDVQKYIQEKNLTIDAKSFFDYFNEGNWTDSLGNKVKNWKQKLLTWNSYKKKEPTLKNASRSDDTGQFNNLDRFYSN